jgi:hypothetical protein
MFNIQLNSPILKFLGMLLSHNVFYLDKKDNIYGYVRSGSTFSMVQFYGINVFSH